MKNSHSARNSVLSFLLVLTMLVGILGGVTTAAAASDSEWRLSVDRIVLASELKTDEEKIEYDGSSYTVTHRNTPSEGCCYAIVAIEATKPAPASALDLSGVQLAIGNERYDCVPDSSFLSFHDYTVLSPSLITSGSGWIAFEIPEGYLNADPNGWYVICGEIVSSAYSAEALPLVPQKSSEVAHSDEIEKTILAQYEAGGKATLDSAMVVPDAYGNAPLTALILFETASACSVSVTVKGHTPDADISYPVQDSVTHHEVPVFGLYPGETNTVIVSTSDGASRTFSIATGALPSGITTVTPAEGNRVASIADGQLYMLQDPDFLVFDRYGEIRWYINPKYASDNCAIAFTLLEDNSGFWGAWHPSIHAPNFSCTEIFRISWAGRIDRQFSYEQFDADHDGTILPNGHYLYIGSHNARPRICELDPETGAMSVFLELNQLLDPDAGNLDAETDSEVDWAHVNTVEYIAENDSILISLRNQHMVLDLDYQTKTPIWVMTPASARDENGVPYAIKQPSVSGVLVMPDEDDAAFEWFYCQHDASFISYDAENQLFDLVLFDNGSCRWVNGVEPENDLTYSRVVRYQVNIAERSVRQVFEYGSEEGQRLYSRTYGSADFIPGSGNYLGNFRGHNDVMPDSVVKEVDANGVPVAEYLIGNAPRGSYRVNPLFLTGSSFKNSGLGTKTGVEFYRYRNAVWTESDWSGTSEQPFAVNVLEDIGTDGNTITLFGRVKANKDSATSDAELVAVDAAGRAYSHPLVVVYSGGNYYGRSIPLSTLPAGVYTLYLRSTSKGGAAACESLGYRLLVGDAGDGVEPAGSVENTDLLQHQAEVDQSLRRMLAEGSYTLSAPFVAVDPYGISPLTAVAAFKTDMPAAITVSIAGLNGAAAVTKELETVGTEHYVPIYGLYAGQETQVTLTARYTDGTTAQQTLGVTGNALPAGFAPIGVVSADASKMAEGWTFAAPANVAGNNYAIDETGAVRWLLNATGFGAPSRMVLLQNGHLLLAGEKNLKNYVKYNLQEIDLLGRIYHEYLIDGYHHGMAEGPNGNIIALVGHFADGNEDTLCEIDRNTGEILRYWDMDWYFNVDNRNDQGVHIADVNYNGTADWLHTNALDYSAEHNSVIISGRQQDAIIELDLYTGEINWVLSDPDDLWPDYLKGKLLTPQGEDFEWQYGNHCCSYLPNGDILLFDNGDYRSKTAEGIVPAPEGYSRAVVYRIDRENMTVQQVWQFGKELGQEALACYVSGAYLVGENDYLINFGGIIKDAAGNASYSMGDARTGSSGAEFYEVRDGEVVFHAKQLIPGNGHNLFQANRFRPYYMVDELDPAQKGTRIGANFHTDEPKAYSFDAATAVTGGPEIDVSFNGVQLITAGTLETEAQSIGLIFAGKSAAYRAALPAGKSLASTRNASNIPKGDYALYLEIDGTVYDLLLNWSNTADRRETPASFRVSIDAAEDLSYGEGEYYENTAFVVSAPAGSKVRMIPNGGMSFSVAVRDLNLWDLPVSVTVENGVYTFAMPDEDVSVILTAQGKLERRFTDVGVGAYYTDAVDWAVSKGVTNGTSATEFSPDKQCTRAEIVTFLWRAAGMPAPSGGAAFQDVAADQYYAKAVAWAVEAGITNGVGDGRFGPNQTCTRGEAVTFLWRYMKCPAAKAKAAFIDVMDGDYFAEAVAWATEAGITNGVGNNSFAPAQICSRAQIVTLLYRSAP